MRRRRRPAFSGANVENASYGLAICAERTAVFAAVLAGARRIAALAVAADPRRDDRPAARAARCWPSSRRPAASCTRAAPASRTSALGELLPARLRTAVSSSGARPDQDATRSCCARATSAKPIGSSRSSRGARQGRRGRQGRAADQEHFSGRLELLSESTLTLHRGRKLDIITSAVTVRSHWPAIVEPAASRPRTSLSPKSSTCSANPNCRWTRSTRCLRGASRALAATAEPAGARPALRTAPAARARLGAEPRRCVRCAAASTAGGAGSTSKPADSAAKLLRRRGDMHALEAADVENFRALGAPRGGRPARGARRDAQSRARGRRFGELSPRTAAQVARAAGRRSHPDADDGGDRRARRRLAPHRRRRQRSARKLRASACARSSARTCATTSRGRRDRARDGATTIVVGDPLTLAGARGTGGAEDRRVRRAPGARVRGPHRTHRRAPDDGAGQRTLIGADVSRKAQKRRRPAGGGADPRDVLRPRRARELASARA